MIYIFGDSYLYCNNITYCKEDGMKEKYMVYQESEINEVLPVISLLEGINEVKFVSSPLSAIQ